MAYSALDLPPFLNSGIQTDPVCRFRSRLPPPPPRYPQSISILSAETTGIDSDGRANKYP